MTAVAQPVSISTHSSSDPSCDPHDAAIRYCSGSCEFECCATFSTEKSLVDEAVREAAERERDEEELRERGRPRDRHQRGVAPLRADQRQRALRDGDQQREDQREVAEFRNHLPSFSVDTDMPCPLCAWSTAAAASGGM